MHIGINSDMAESNMIEGIKHTHTYPSHNKWTRRVKFIHLFSPEFCRYSHKNAVYFNECEGSKDPKQVIRILDIC